MRTTVREDKEKNVGVVVDVLTIVDKRAIIKKVITIDIPILILAREPSSCSRRALLVRRVLR